MYRMDREMNWDMVLANRQGDNVVTLQMWREVPPLVQLEFQVEEILTLALLMTVCTADHSQTCPAMLLPSTRTQFTVMSATRVYLCRMEAESSKGGACILPSARTT